MGKLKESLPDDYFKNGYWRKASKLEYMANLRIRNPLLLQEILSGHREYYDHHKWIYTGNEYVKDI